MLHRYRVAALALGCALVLPQLAGAVVLVNDTWKDGTDADPASTVYSEFGSDVDGDGDIESAWFQGGIGTVAPVGVNGPLRSTTYAADVGPGVATSSASWTTYFTPEGSEVNLANEGDGLRVTWKFKLSNVNASNTGQGFKFGLVDSSTRVTTPNSSPPSGVYAGYAMIGNMGQTLGNGNSFQLRERTLTDPGTLLNTNGDFGSILGNGANSGRPGYVADVEYTMVWLMTRSGTTLNIDLSMTGGTLDADGVAQVIVIDDTPNTFKYDTFAIRPSSEVASASHFDTSLFRVETLSSSNADFDGLGGVDGRDFLIWQRGNGAIGTGTLAFGDANNDTNVDAADLAIWRSQFGPTLVASPVPEPSSLVCGLFAVMAAAGIRRSR